MNYLRLKQIFNNTFDEDDVDDLFRQIPEKEVSPAQWDKQIKFWSKIILQWAADSEIVECKVSDLISNLTWSDLVPPLIPTIQYLVSTKSCKLETDYQNRSTISKLAHSLARMISTPSISPESKLIFPQNLKMLCRRIHENVTSQASLLSDYVITSQELNELSHGTSLDVIASELCNEKLVIPAGNGGFFFQDESNKHVAKELIFAMQNSKSLLSKLQNLSTEIEKCLQNQIQQAKKLQNAKRHKDAILATKRVIIEREKLEKINKLHSAIQTSIDNLDKTDMNVFVMKQMMAINKLSKTKFSLDNVDTIIDQYEETVEENNEITDALTSANQRVFDDDELENELNNLMEENDEDFIKVPKVQLHKFDEEPATYQPVAPQSRKQKVLA